MKKFIVIMTVLVMFSLTAVTFASNYFSDVPEDHWAAEAVNRLAAEGIVIGYPDETYKGDWQLTRYEYAMIVDRLMDDIAEADEKLLADIKALEEEFKAELEELRSLQTADREALENLLQLVKKGELNEVQKGILEKMLDELLEQQKLALSKLNQELLDYINNLELNETQLAMIDDLFATEELENKLNNILTDYAEQDKQIDELTSNLAQLQEIVENPVVSLSGNYQMEYNYNLDTDVDLAVHELGLSLVINQDVNTVLDITNYSQPAADNYIVLKGKSTFNNNLYLVYGFADADEEGVLGVGSSLEFAGFQFSPKMAVKIDDISDYYLALEVNGNLGLVNIRYIHESVNGFANSRIIKSLDDNLTEGEFNKIITSFDVTKALNVGLSLEFSDIDIFASYKPGSIDFMGLDLAPYSNFNYSVDEQENELALGLIYTISPNLRTNLEYRNDTNNENNLTGGLSLSF